MVLVIARQSAADNAVGLAVVIVLLGICLCLARKPEVFYRAFFRLSPKYPEVVQRTDRPYSWLAVALLYIFILILVLGVGSFFAQVV